MTARLTLQELHDAGLPDIRRRIGIWRNEGMLTSDTADRFPLDRVLALVEHHTESAARPEPERRERPTRRAA
ncbi:MAG: hypothetical protein OJJ54_24990 [Pseudonocardia sp.]|nr:hypothetical protein [Pseudonocardia sp.]